MIRRIRRGNWLLTLPLVAIGVCYLYFLFLPTKLEIHRLRGELKKKQLEITQAQPMKLALFEKQQEFEEAEEFVSGWMKQNENEAASVLADISREVQASGVQTIRFDPQPTTRMRSLKKTPLVLGTEGTFAQHFDMLRRLEALPATVWIEKFSLQAPTSSGEYTSSEVSLAIFAVNRDISD